MADTQDSQEYHAAVLLDDLLHIAFLGPIRGTKILICLSPFLKVPVIMHDESEQARAWGQMYSSETQKESIPVITAWQLNERM